VKPKSEIVTPRRPVRRTILNATPERARYLSEYVAKYGKLPPEALAVIERERNGGQPK
jgi:hypothetical protein